MAAEIDLTILLFVDAEKPITWDHRWFGAVRELNPSVWDRINVVVVSQRKSSDSIRRIAAKQPFRVEVHDVDHPRDSNDYPIWDVCQGVREVWPLVCGKYVSFNHVEYIHGPGRLAKTCDWLRTNRPHVAMGNLRRIVAHTYDWKKRIRDVKDPLNTTFSTLIDDCYWAFLQDHWDLFPQVPWIYWQPEPSVDQTEFLEDVFFAEKEWFETLKFFQHGGRLPFQDVYDLMYPGLLQLETHGLAPPCYRLPRDVHEACHVLHDRAWGSYTPSMRAWFKRHEEEWAGTALVLWDLWDKILQPDGCGDESPGQAIDRFRRGPGGTVTRWMQDFTAYLAAGGADRLQEYYQNRDLA